VPADDSGVGSPSFTFRLERVRSLRERAEEQAREELAKGLSHRLQGEALLQQASDTVGAARRTSLGLSTGRAASAHELMAAQAYIERTERDQHAASLDLDRRDAEVVARRTTLAAAAQELEAIERLKRRARSEWVADSARAEQINLDEIALAVHRRKQVAAA
jgi:flagellar FliJ protein